MPIYLIYSRHPLILVRAPNQDAAVNFYIENWERAPLVIVEEFDPPIEIDADGLLIEEA
jgi:hypothetical protein